MCFSCSTLTEIGMINLNKKYWSPSEWLFEIKLLLIKKKFAEGTCLPYYVKAVLVARSLNPFLIFLSCLTHPVSCFLILAGVWPCVVTPWHHICSASPLVAWTAQAAQTSCANDRGEGNKKKRELWAIWHLTTIPFLNKSFPDQITFWGKRNGDG